MTWEDIMKMKDLAEMINVDGDDPLMPRSAKDRLNRFLNDKDFAKMGLEDLLFTLDALSTLAKMPEARIPDNLRGEAQSAYRKMNIFMGSIVPLQRELKKELEELFYLNRVEQGKMSMRDYDEGLQQR